MGVKRPGFTFLEVMIVVVILGILAVMAMPDLSRAADEAKAARIQADLGTIGSAVELYYSKHGTYPASIESLCDKENGFLKKKPETPDVNTSYELNSSTGEVTCTFKNKTYSSFGTSHENKNG